MLIFLVFHTTKYGLNCNLLQLLLRYLNTQHIKKQSADAQFRKLRSLKTLASFKNGTFYDKSTEQMKEIRELVISFSVYFCFNIIPQVKWFNMLFLKKQKEYVQ